jgi:transcriptional regulator with XRE-family HTH domain
MSAKLSKKEIGIRIANIRKAKGLSQQELAKNIGISRPSLAQIELGNRNLDIMELQNLSITLGFSIDEFVAKDFEKSQILEDESYAAIYAKPLSAKKNSERISTPVFRTDKFRNILLYILGNCAGKPNVGETVLYKLLYFADFNYYEQYESHLSGSTYRKLPFGPVPRNLDEILNQMITENQIIRIKTEYCGYPQTRYLPLVKPDLTNLKASEKEVLDRVVEQFSDWSATAISNYSHKDLPWVVTKEGEEINYELAFYREAPYSVRNYGDETEVQ